jgi:hypothetical protein
MQILLNQPNIPWYALYNDRKIFDFYDIICFFKGGWDGEFEYSDYSPYSSSVFKDKTVRQNAYSDGIHNFKCVKDSQ